MTKPLKEKTFDVKFAAFPYVAKIVLTNNVSSSRKKRDRVIGRTMRDPTGTALCSVVDGRGISYIFIPFGCDGCVITHEAVHVIYNLYNWVGIQEDDSEVFAYLLEHLLRNIYKRFK